MVLLAGDLLSVGGHALQHQLSAVVKAKFEFWITNMDIVTDFLGDVFKLLGCQSGIKS